MYDSTNYSADLEKLLSYPALIKVVSLDDYYLLATFSNGESKKVDIKPYFKWKVFQPLKDENLFKQAHAEYGGVVWNSKIDLAQEALYDKGVPV